MDIEEKNVVETTLGANELKPVKRLDEDGRPVITFDSFARDVAKESGQYISVVKDVMRNMDKVMQRYVMDRREFPIMNCFKIEYRVNYYKGFDFKKRKKMLNASPKATIFPRPFLKLEQDFENKFTPK